MIKMIDKTEYMSNNANSLIKRFIKEFNQQKMITGGKQYVTTGNDKTRRNYF